MLHIEYNMIKPFNATLDRRLSKDGHRAAHKLSVHPGVIKAAVSVQGGDGGHLISWRKTVRRRQWVRATFNTV